MGRDADSAVAHAATWLGNRREHIAWALVALALTGAVGTSVAAGFVLHHLAALERQGRRTESLGNAVFQLQNTLVAEPGKRLESLGEAALTFALIQGQDPAEATNVAPAYHAYVNAWRSVASVAVLRSRLAELQDSVRAEIEREAHSSRAATPIARALLIAAVSSAVVLVGLLGWLFQMERKAG
ncbi:MAG: hypothetical protein JOY72_07595, partial [Actinobacteria bacterium]|nr:hypothetical protein [Actinomycetota bacterium]